MEDSATLREGDIEPVEPAYRQVADRLRELVLSGELQPGERLPSETDLSTMFDVSRSTVREALRVLSSTDLITTRRGVTGGSFIAHPAPGDVAEYLEMSFNLLTGTQVVTVSELLEARALLEVPAARLAAERHDPDDLRRLTEALEEEHAAITDSFEGRRRFHERMLEASGNGLLSMLTQPLFTTLRSRFLRDRVPQAFWEQVIEDHQDIHEQISQGDGPGAAEAMAAHLNRLRDTYERIDRLAEGPALGGGTDRGGES